MRTVYIANDGTQFDDEYECQDYEFKLEHPHLKEILMFDKNKQPLDDIFSEDTYGNVYEIYVPTRETVRDLQALSVYTGFCEYEKIEDPGTYIYEDADGYNGYFRKLGD